MNYTPSNILVTGGAGFIGSHFIISMLNHHKNIQIINLDKLTYAANLLNLEAIKNSPRYTFHQGDICDSDLVKNILVNYNIDTIVNFAAESHVDRSIHDPSPFIKTNIYGTYNLLQCSYLYWQKKFDLDPNRCRFHQVSTDEVYGSLTIDQPAFTENSSYKPNSPYSASKAAADHQVRAYHHTYHLPATISHCSNNYGANQHAEKFIPTVIRSCLENKPIPIYNDGSNIRDWIFVEDHCHGIEAILYKGIPGQIYDMGGNEEMSNLNLTQLICDEVNKMVLRDIPYTQLISFVEDRKGHDFRYAINNDFIQSSLGWQPLMRLKNILPNLIKHTIGALCIVNE